MTNPMAPEAMFGEGGLAAFWHRLKKRWRPEPLDSADALRTFVEERASFIAQKCAVDYCRGKTGLASYALFSERPFLDAFDVCRWEVFAAALGDLLIIAEGQLRSHVPSQQRGILCDRLVRIHREILSGLPLPSHRPQGWDDATGAFPLRLQAAVAKAPQKALDVADYSAKRLFDTLPIHISMRELDEEVVYGAVRFRMIAVSQEMQQQMRAGQLAAALLQA